MKLRNHTVAAVSALVLVAATVVAQAPDQDGGPKGAAARHYTAPKAKEGKPELQGTWANNIATPLERPKELAGKPVLTDAELKSFKERAARLFTAGSDAAFADGFYQAVLANPDAYASSDGRTGNWSSFD